MLEVKVNRVAESPVPVTYSGLGLRTKQVPDGIYKISGETCYKKCRVLSVHGVCKLYFDHPNERPSNYIHNDSFDDCRWTLAVGESITFTDS